MLLSLSVGLFTTGWVGYGLWVILTGKSPSSISVAVVGGIGLLLIILGATGVLTRGEEISRGTRG